VNDRRHQFIAYVRDWETDAATPITERPFHGHLDPLTDDDDDDWAHPFGIDDVPLAEALVWARRVNERSRSCCV
jgi:hypothetical protein